MTASHMFYALLHIFLFFTTSKVKNHKISDTTRSKIEVDFRQRSLTEDHNWSTNPQCPEEGSVMLQYQISINSIYLTTNRIQYVYICAWDVNNK